MIPTQLLLSAQLITLRDNLQLLHVGPLTKLAACAAATAALWLTLKYGRTPASAAGHAVRHPSLLPCRALGGRMVHC